MTIRSLSLNLSLAVTSTLLALLAAEGAIRLLAPIYTPPLDYVQTGELYQTDGALGWRLLPGAQAERIGKEFRASTVVNSLGMRDREYTVSKPPDTRRIVVLGDSFVEGWHVPLEQVLTEVLEERINLLGKARYEVLNLGVSGYSLGQYALLLSSEVRFYQPDLVILVLYLGNDIVDTVPGLGFERHDKPTYSLDGERLVLHPPAPEGICVPCQKPTGLFQWLREHSALLSVVRQNSLVKQMLAALGLSDLIHGSYALGEAAPLRADYSPEMEEAFAVARLLLQQSDTVVRDWGARLLIVLAPNRDWLNEANWQRYLAGYPSLQGYDFELDKPQRLLLGYCESDGLWCFDLSPALREAVEEGKQPYFIRYDIHWTADGHRIVAEALLPVVAPAILP